MSRLKHPGEISCSYVAQQTDVGALKSLRRVNCLQIVKFLHFFPLLPAKPAPEAGFSVECRSSADPGTLIPGSHDQRKPNL